MYTNYYKSDYQKIHTGIDYLHTINKKWFKLDINIICVPYSEKTTFARNNGKICLAFYESKSNHWRLNDQPLHKYGHITLNVETLLKLS